MQVTIDARHFNARDDLKDYIERELERLKKKYDRIVDVHVTLDGKLDKKMAQISVKVWGQTLVASETANKFEIAVDAAVDKLDKQIIRYKDKLAKR